MEESLLVSVGAASLYGILHTVAGPDHYLPFIVLSKARNWGITKTSIVTIICGIGHILSSVLLGILIGYGVGSFLENNRGDWAAISLMVFGGLYFVWGAWRAIQNKPHKHSHFHKDGTVHAHEHKHENGHAHVHNKSITPWLLFIVFVLGPCEPLTAALIKPAAEMNTSQIVFTTIIFGLVTIITMLIIVVSAYYGIKFIPMRKAERYMHAIAGLTIFLCGASIMFLGW